MSQKSRVERLEQGTGEGEGTIKVVAWGPEEKVFVAGKEMLLSEFQRRYPDAEVIAWVDGPEESQALEI